VEPPPYFFLPRQYLLSTTESSTIVVFGTTLDITVASVQVSLPDGGAVHVHSEATYVPIEARFVELNLFRTKVRSSACSSVLTTQGPC